MSTRGIEEKFERFLLNVKIENQKYHPKKEKPKVIGYITYDFKNKTETYTPVENSNNLR